MFDVDQCVGRQATCTFFEHTLMFPKQFSEHWLVGVVSLSLSLSEIMTFSVQLTHMALSSSLSSCCPGLDLYGLIYLFSLFTRSTKSCPVSVFTCACTNY